jgi:DNA polymerase-4
MWGAGKKTQAILEAHNIRTIGDLQTIAPGKLAAWVGENSATFFRRLAFGIDERELTMDSEEKSISNEITFDEDQRDAAVVEAALLDLADKVGTRLRRAGFYASTAQIKLRWKDFTTITRQRRLDPPCCDDMTLRETALELFRKESLHSAIRLIGFGVSGLRRTANAPQLDLFQSPEKQTSTRREQLSRAVDRIRERFGRKSIRRGSTMNDET